MGILKKAKQLDRNVEIFAAVVSSSERWTQAGSHGFSP